MKPSHSGRILALDYGRKRIGLAISGEAGLAPMPLSIFVRKNRADDLRRLRQIVRDREISRVVVGLPLHLDGADSEMAAEARAFATRLRKHLGLPVELYDERLTSWEAGQIAKMSSAKARNSATRARDDVAAAVLLRDYLAAHPAHSAVSQVHASIRPTANGAKSGKS